MRLATVLAEVSAQPPPSRCPVAVVLAALGKEDAATLRGALDDVAITGSVIATALRKQGYAMKDEPLRRHRRGACACG